MKTIKNERINQRISQEQLSGFSGVPLFKIRHAEKGLPILSELEASRIGFVLGYAPPIPTFLEKYIYDGAVNDY